MVILNDFFQQVGRGNVACCLFFMRVNDSVRISMKSIRVSAVKLSIDYNNIAQVSAKLRNNNKYKFHCNVKYS